MKNKYLKKRIRTALAMVAIGAMLPTTLFATEWSELFPEDWKGDDLRGNPILCCVNWTKSITWYPSGYFYGILENTFNYAPDDPATTTPWIADEEGTVEDYEGNVYKTLRFGDTWWMAENLRTKVILDSTGNNPVQMTKYLDWNGACGGGINEDEFLYTSANDDADNDSVYGCLYSWPVAFSTLSKKKKLLKDEGWVAPDTLDFYNLIKRFGLWDYAVKESVLQTFEYIWTVTEVPSFGLFLKSDRNTLWKPGSPRAGEIPYNASGLGFPPAGQMEGTHSGFGTRATIWTGVSVHFTEYDGLGRRYLVLGNENNTMTAMAKGYAMARSVRLIKRIKRIQNEDGTYTATNETAWCPGYITGYKSTSTAIASTLAEQGITVWGTSGYIMVKGCAPGLPIDIYSTSGIKIKTTIASGTMELPMPTGLYIVRINGIGKKVVVND